MRRLCLVLSAAALVASGGALAPEVHAAASPVQTAAQAKRAFLEHPKVARWLGRYRGSTLQTSAQVDPTRSVWNVRVLALGHAEVVATGKVYPSGSRFTLEPGTHRIDVLEGDRPQGSLNITRSCTIKVEPELGGY